MQKKKQKQKNFYIICLSNLLIMSDRMIIIPERLLKYIWTVSC